MSIASRITSIEGHIGDIYDSVELTGVDTTDIDKNLVNVPNTLKEGYIDIINNGTDTLYNNFPKVSGEGTSLTLNNTYQAPMRNNLKGNTSQTGTPTPTSPIPVNVVRGDNTITISNQSGTDSNTYNIDLPVENLFDKANISWVRNNNADYSLATDNSNTRIRTMTPIKLIGGKTYTLSGYPSSVSINSIKFYANLGDTTTVSTVNTSTFTVPTNATYVIFQFSGTGFTSATNTLMANANIMLEKGSKANSYTPFGTTPIELCKIGNYQDYFYKDSGKWYLHKEIGKVVLNGSENWQYYNGIQYITSISDYKLSGLICLCSHYIAQQNVSISGDMIDKHIAFRNTVNNPNLYIKDSTYTDSTTFKTWLSTHNTSVYYVLETPTTTEITDTTLINQLEELYIAKSKENQTNISQINNDLGFIISASALKKG